MEGTYASANTTSTLENIVNIRAPSIPVSHPVYNTTIRCIVICIAARLLGSKHVVFYGIVAGSLSFLQYQNCELGAASRSIYSFAVGYIVISSLSAYQSLQNCLISTLGNRKNLHTLAKLKQFAESSRSVVKPLLFPSRTSHRRLIPTPHNFSYPYLLVGVPVKWTGTAGSFLSAHDSGAFSEAWLSVHAQDYLQRGASYDGLSLQRKLDLYLESQGAHPDALPHAYLVTAPRVAGFSFNPVSFWYLYNKEGQLRAMILEVNNTFGERRVYFLCSTHDAGNSSSRVNFRAVWQKDFHVSPFNDRDGTYSVSAKDPRKHGHIDNTIVLKSPTGEAKVVARVFTTTQGIDPELMTSIQKLCFLLKWGSSGFLTNPRILKEARVLWMRNLQVFYRPEPQQGTVARIATKEEIVIERWFTILLDRMASQMMTHSIYRPAAGNNLGQAVALGPAVATSHAEIEVLTPAFYSELARTQDRLADVISRCSSSGQATALITTSDQNALKDFISKLSECFSQQSMNYSWRIRSLMWLLGIDSPAKFSTLSGRSDGCNDDRGSWSPMSLLVECATTRCTAGVDNGSEERDCEALLRACLLIRCADICALGSTSFLRIQLRVARLAILFLIIWILL